MTSCSHCGLSHPRDDEMCPVTGESYAVAGLCGTTLDRYRIEKWLGGGGFGAVYRARHTVMDRAVALKVLHARIRTQPAAVKRFFGEAKAATAIGHPGIVQVFDAGTTAEGHAFLAMELIEGCSLKDLAEVGPIRPARAIRIVLAVLEALAAAHAAGIIHRDVKPGNIMLGGTRPDGSRKNDRVRLVDFGVSKVRQTRDPDDITRSGMAMGSPGYAAPEQYVSAKTADARSDIYGASVVLYELLTGTLPFDAESYEQMVVKVCSQDPRPLARANAQIPPKLAELVDRGVARDPDARWASVAEMIQALEPWVTRLEGATAPTQLAPSVPPPAMSIDSESREETFIEAEPDSPAPSSAPTVPPPAEGTSPVTPTESPVATSRARPWMQALVALVLLGVGAGGALWLGGRDEDPPPPLGAAPVAVPVSTGAEPTTPVPVPSLDEEGVGGEEDRLEEPEEQAAAPDAGETSEGATPAMHVRARRSRMRSGAMTPAMEGEVAMASMRQFGFEDIEPFDPD